MEMTQAEVEQNSLYPLTFMGKQDITMNGRFLTFGKIDLYIGGVQK